MLDNEMLGIEISEELKDLLKVYTDASEHLQKKEKEALEIMTRYMQVYLKAKEEREKVSSKLSTLKYKMDNAIKCKECDEDKEEDQE